MTWRGAAETLLSGGSSLCMPLAARRSSHDHDPATKYDTVHTASGHADRNEQSRSDTFAHPRQEKRRKTGHERSRARRQRRPLCRWRRAHEKDQGHPSRQAANPTRILPGWATVYLTQHETAARDVRQTRGQRERERERPICSTPVYVSVRCQLLAHARGGDGDRSAVYPPPPTTNPRAAALQPFFPCFP